MYIAEIERIKPGEILVKGAADAGSHLFSSTAFWLAILVLIGVKVLVFFVNRIGGPPRRRKRRR